MRVRWLAWPVSLGAGYLIFFLFQELPTELAPMEDKSGFRIMATAPEGTSFEVMDEYMLQVLNIVDTIPEKKAYIALTAPGFSGGSSNTGRVFLSLSEPNERTRSQDEIVKSIYPKISQLNYARAFISQAQTIEVGGGGMRGLPVQYVIQAPNFDKLKTFAPEVCGRGSKTSGIQCGGPQPPLQ